MKFGLVTVVVPETLVIDHGKSFKVPTRYEHLSADGISIQPHVYWPGQGHHRTFFRTLREDLLRLLPGYKICVS